MNSSRQSLYITLAINLAAWLLVMALFFGVQVVQAAAPVVTTATWLEPEQKLRVLGEGGEPGQRVYVRVPETVGNRHVQADGSFRFNKQGVYPPPCEVHLLPQFGAPGPTHAIADPRDFLTGEAIRHECMPEPTKSIFEAHEFGAGVRWLMRPAEWCRWEPDAAKAIYWPRPASGDCTADVGHQEMVIAFDDARMSARANGADTWEGGIVDIHPTTDLIITEFTVDAMIESAGAFTSPATAGHIIMSTQSFNSTAPGAYCTAAHEWEHSNVQNAAFASMAVEQWGNAVWPEALAMLHMRNVAACADFWDELHCTPSVPCHSRWVTGYYGPDQRRQIGLFFGYLGDRYGINWYDWMLDQHALLLAGDEIGALEAAIAPAILDREWARFVAAYNHRDATALPGIDALGPPDPFPALPSFGDDITAVGNGMVEGDTKAFIIPAGITWRALSYHASPRCPESTACYVVTEPSGQQAPWVACSSGQGGLVGFSPGAHTITTASLNGDAHWAEIILSSCDIPPCDPWPAPDLNDPWQGVACP